MNIKKLTKTVSSVLLLSAALFTGCQKDGDRVFSLFAESFDGNGKLAVNGASANWVNGDQIKINGETKSVAVDGSGNASVSSVSRAAAYRAVYPAGICPGSLASNSVTVNLPSVYNYAVDGSGNQILHSPMAAYLVDDGSTDQIFFKHLTSAIVVRITNNVEFDLNVNQIKITSDNYNISGNLSFDISNIAGISPVSGGNSVTMSFPTSLVIPASGGSADIQIPVAAVGPSNHFTVEVSSNFQVASGNTKYLTFSKQQTTGGALDRGQVAYAMVTMGRNAANCIEDIPLTYSDGAYLIETPSQFLVFVEAVNTGAATYYGGATTGTGNARNDFFRLAANIDMSGYVVAPIHDYHKTLDGQGHTISNLHIVQDGSSASNGLGLFATHLNYAMPVAKNLTLNNLTLEYTGPAVGEVSIGGFVGDYQASGSNALENCNINGMSIVSSTLSGGSYNVGGLIGKVRGSSNLGISSCNVNNISYNITNAPGALAFGGLIGLNYTGGTCTTTIESSSYSNASQINLHHRKSITALYGGLIGQNQARNLMIQGCSAANNAKIGGQSTSYIAGLVGVLQTGVHTATIISSSASGNITYRGNKNGGYNPIACNKTGYSESYSMVNTTGLTLTPYDF